MHPGTDTATPNRPSLFRKNTLDEMTVGRTEKPVEKARPKKPSTAPSRGEVPSSPNTIASDAAPATDAPAKSGWRRETIAKAPVRGAAQNDAEPVRRHELGRGSYEDEGEEKRKKRRPTKTGRPGR